MSDGLIHIAIAVGSALLSATFSAGIALGALRRVRTDVNAIGGKIKAAERDALRRHHNVSLVLMLAAPIEKEREICELLKEG